MMMMMMMMMMINILLVVFMNLHVWSMARHIFGQIGEVSLRDLKNIFFPLKTVIPSQDLPNIFQNMAIPVIR